MKRQARGNSQQGRLRFVEELFQTAEAYQVNFYFEASVGGGIPVIHPLKQYLGGNRINEVIGIVNGTTSISLPR